jgi:hypothetical protein
MGLLDAETMAAVIDCRDNPSPVPFKAGALPDKGADNPWRRLPQADLEAIAQMTGMTRIEILRKAVKHLRRDLEEGRL